MPEAERPFSDPEFATRFAAFALACWFSHDGQWFLKMKEAYGLETAMAMNERVARAMARIQARRLRELTGVDEIEDCRQLARLLPLVHPLFFLSRLDGVTDLGTFADAYTALTKLAPGAGRVIDVDDDHVEIGFARCLLAEMARASGTAVSAGALPGCRGLASWFGACGVAFSPRYDFVHEERAGAPDSGFVCHHRITRVPKNGR